MAAVAGVFAAVAYTLVDAWTRLATGVLWRQGLKWRMPRALGQSYGIMLLVAGVAVFISLPLAIGIGVLVSILMFIRSNSKRPIRKIVHADRRSSRKIRPAHEAESLRVHGKRIALRSSSMARCSSALQRQPTMRSSAWSTFRIR